MYLVLLLLAAVTLVAVRYGADTTEPAEWRWGGLAGPSRPARSAHSPADDFSRLLRAALSARRVRARHVLR